MHSFIWQILREAQRVSGVLQGVGGLLLLATPGGQEMAAAPGVVLSGGVREGRDKVTEGIKLRAEEPLVYLSAPTCLHPILDSSSPDSHQAPLAPTPHHHASLGRVRRKFFSFFPRPTPPPKALGVSLLRTLLPLLEC